MIDSIEPKIKPLVDAINETNICWTFSSCEGHYYENEQLQMDRNRANVRFEPCNNIPIVSIELFINFLVSEFDSRHSFNPIILTSYKLYRPCNIEPIFVIELVPFNRFDNPFKKRLDTDNAILQATTIVKKYTKRFLTQ